MESDKRAAELRTGRVALNSASFDLQDHRARSVVVQIAAGRHVAGPSNVHRGARCGAPARPGRRAHRLHRDVAGAPA